MLHAIILVEVSSTLLRSRTANSSVAEGSSVLVTERCRRPTRDERLLRSTQKHSMLLMEKQKLANELTSYSVQAIERTPVVVLADHIERINTHVRDVMCLIEQ